MFWSCKNLSNYDSTLNSHFNRSLLQFSKNHWTNSKSIVNYQLWKQNSWVKLNALKVSFRCLSLIGAENRCKQVVGNSTPSPSSQNYTNKPRYSNHFDNSVDSCQPNFTTFKAKHMVFLNAHWIYLLEVDKLI